MIMKLLLYRIIRLTWHMILAYITNTPCIALDNNNHKIGSIYKTWLKEQSLIFMSDDIQTIEKYGKNT